MSAIREADLKIDSLLEVGAGFGYFLDRVADVHVARGKIHATEYGAPAIQELRRKGYNVHAGDVSEVRPDQPFDVVCMFQVLEHMDRLDETGQALRRLVRPGGSVLIAVPNPARIAFNEANGSLLDMPPNHIGRWSRRAFEIFAADHGFRLVEHDVEPQERLGFVKADIGYAYLRRSQMPGTLAHWSRQQRDKPLGKAIGVAAAVAGGPSRLPVWAKAMTRHDLGGSAFARLERLS